ncbi:MAG: hypothetical protein ACRC14_01075 [Paracoccaceae bacterium]
MTSTVPAPPLRVLVLDMLPTMAALLPEDAILEQASLGDLDADLLARLTPERIVLPLMARGHDAMTIIEQLESLGYRGAITVVAPALPHPRMVERELRGLGPGNRLRLVTP